MALHFELLLLGCSLLYTISTIQGTTAQEYNEELFIRPGLVWIEDIDGVMLFQHIYLTSDLWRKRELPTAIPIARTMPYTNNFTHIDVDIANRTMVMVDSNSQKIVALSFDSFGLSTYWDLYEGTSHKVNGIAVDWVTDVVYWTDAAYDVILAVSMFSPNMAEVIVESQLVEPYGIVTYPQEGYLFWTDIDESNPRLMRSTLGGRRIETLIRFSRIQRRAMSLYFDNRERRLYWIYTHTSEAGELQGVSSCDIHGHNVKHLQIAISSNYFDIAVYTNHLLYIEFGRVHVYKNDRLTSSKGRPQTLMVMDGTLQDIRHNPCLYSHCPGICTKSGFTENCFCHANQLHRVDPEIRDKYCEMGPFTGLLLPKGDGIYTLKTNFVEYKSTSTLSKVKPQKILDNHRPVKAITSDVRAMKIFFYEYRTNMIKSLRTEQDSEPKVVSLAIGEVGGLAFDSNTKSLYWTDVLYGHIMVVREDGVFPHILHKHLVKPKAIAIYPQKRQLFWSEIGSGKLMRSYLDGADKYEMFMGARYQIVSIAVNFRKRTLYLCDENSVYEMDMRETFFNTLYRKYHHIFTGLTVVHDYLVVSDTAFRTGGLHVFDRNVRTGDQMTVVGSTVYPDFRYGNWYDVHYHHISNQPSGLDLCAIKDPKCDNLCLPGNRAIRCVCSIGYKANGPICEIDQPYKPFLLLVDQRYRQVLQIHTVSKQFVAVPVQSMRQPFSITYDPVKKMIYWSDLDTGTISRASVNGTNQEVIKYDPRAYFMGLFIEPGSRLLYYVVRHVPDYDRYVQPIGSVVVYNIDTRKTLVLMDRELQDPQSLVINTKHGYIFMTEQKHIWRQNMNRTDFVCLVEFVKSTTLATATDYVYFANEIPSETYYDPVRTQLVRIGIHGENMTMILELTGGSVSDMTVDEYFIYWINSSTRGVQRTSLELPGVIEDVGPSKSLFQPTGLYVSPAEEDFDSTCSHAACGGLCLPTPTEAICEEIVVTEQVIVQNGSGLCQIPNIKHGVVIGNTVARVVTLGYQARVECYPAHTISSDVPVTCMGDTWTDIPTCHLEYSICGTPEKGYKVYAASGTFFAYPEATKVDVICIGGGGGGYDVINNEIADVGKAGDGGDSSFGSYLNAFGGKGGTITHGGNGGLGHVKGGAGASGPNCTTGGTACQAQPSSDPARPGYSDDLFCGAGGFSHECNVKTFTTNEYAGPGGKDGNWSAAGNFGGGAGGRGGGSGGGGGWSRLTVTLPEKALVPVTVGQQGNPSYGHPAPGLVVVMWGDYQADDYVKLYDVINSCVLDDEIETS